MIGSRGPYAVETCPGYEHQPYCMDALGQPRCVHCAWSWGSHRRYGRPHPPEEPPYYDIDDPKIIAMWQMDEDEDEHQQPERAGEDGTPAQHS